MVPVSVGSDNSTSLQNKRFLVVDKQNGNVRILTPINLSPVNPGMLVRPRASDVNPGVFVRPRSSSVLLNRPPVAVSMQSGTPYPYPVRQATNVNVPTRPPTIVNVPTTLDTTVNAPTTLATTLRLPSSLNNGNPRVALLLQPGSQCSSSSMQNTVISTHQPAVSRRISNKSSSPESSSVSNSCTFVTTSTRSVPATTSSSEDLQCSTQAINSLIRLPRMVPIQPKPVHGPSRVITAFTVPRFLQGSGYRLSINKSNFTSVIKGAPGIQEAHHKPGEENKPDVNQIPTNVTTNTTLEDRKKIKEKYGIDLKDCSVHLKRVQVPPDGKVHVEPSTKRPRLERKCKPKSFKNPKKKTTKNKNIRKQKKLPPIKHTGGFMKKQRSGQAGFNKIKQNSIAKNVQMKTVMGQPLPTGRYYVLKVSEQNFAASVAPTQSQGVYTHPYFKSPQSIGSNLPLATSNLQGYHRAITPMLVNVQNTESINVGQLQGNNKLTPILQPLKTKPSPTTTVQYKPPVSSVSAGNVQANPSFVSRKSTLGMPHRVGQRFPFVQSRPDLECNPTSNIGQRIRIVSPSGNGDPINVFLICSTNQNMTLPTNTSAAPSSTNACSATASVPILFKAQTPNSRVTPVPSTAKNSTINLPGCVHPILSLVENTTKIVTVRRSYMVRQPQPTSHAQTSQLSDPLVTFSASSSSRATSSLSFTKLSTVVSNPVQPTSDQDQHRRDNTVKNIDTGKNSISGSVSNVISKKLDAEGSVPITSAENISKDDQSNIPDLPFLLREGIPQDVNPCSISTSFDFGNELQEEPEDFADTQSLCDADQSDQMDCSNLDTSGYSEATTESDMNLAPSEAKIESLRQKLDALRKSQMQIDLKAAVNQSKKVLEQLDT